MVIMHAALLLSGLAVSALAQYSATYLPSNAPAQSEQGQTGTNKCGTNSSQTSMCQNAYLNSVDDFCLFAPPNPGPGSSIGATEQIEVAWCIKSGTGTRLIPDGTIKGAHFVQTPDYVQITGTGDLTQINVLKNDPGGGGELDPHGADGNGNPIGGLVFSSAFGGQIQQMHEWTNFMSDTEFCFRACKDGPNAPALCQHIYDVMGCEWNMPGDYDAGVFEKCAGDSGEPMGVYGASTFHQGDGNTPPAHPAPPSSSCTTLSTIANVAVATTTSASGSTSATTTTSHSGSSTGTASKSGATTGTASTSGATTTTSSSANGRYDRVTMGNGSLTVAVMFAAIGSLVGGILVL